MTRPWQIAVRILAVALTITTLGNAEQLATAEVAQERKSPPRKHQSVMASRAAAEKLLAELAALEAVSSPRVQSSRAAAVASLDALCRAADAWGCSTAAFLHLRETELAQALGYAMAARYLDAPDSQELIEDIRYMMLMAGQRGEGAGTVAAGLVADIRKSRSRAEPR